MQYWWRIPSNGENETGSYAGRTELNRKRVRRTSGKLLKATAISLDWLSLGSTLILLYDF